MTHNPKAEVTVKQFRRYHEQDVFNDMRAEFEIMYRLSCTETGRWIDLTEDQHRSHNDVLCHWCRGGDIETKDNSGRDQIWSDLADSSRQHITGLLGNGWLFRVKERKPKTGEVWVGYGKAMVRTVNGRDNHDAAAWYDLDDNRPHGVDMSDIEYAAPSVEAYFARKFYENCEDEGLYSVVEYACAYED